MSSHAGQEGCGWLMKCVSSPNIAIVKYWGKRDEHLVLPLNSSLSITLHSDDIRTTSWLYEVPVSETSSKTNEPQVELVLNDQTIPVNSRLANIIQMLRDQATDGNRKHRSLRIVSFNDFPTASGMASSASGFAAIAHLLCSYFHVGSDWSVFARLGSGSACRSMLGGFVLWDAGTCSEDSLAKKVFDESHWPELRILVLVFSSRRKTNSSTSGMQTSVKTSELLTERVRRIPERIEQLKKAIESRDFESFADVCMRESNQLHAICLDSMPPISYLNTQSFELIDAIHAFNRHCEKKLACYSFDAGPNAFVFFEEQTKPKLYSWLIHVFPQCKLDSWDEREYAVADCAIPVCSLSRNENIPYFETRVGFGPTLTCHP